MTPRTVAHQAPLSVGFSTQQYWSVGELKEAVSGNFHTNRHLVFPADFGKDSSPSHRAIGENSIHKKRTWCQLHKKNLGHPVIFTKAPEARGKLPG